MLCCWILWKALPHPVGGSCWNKDSVSNSTSETNTGWSEEAYTAPNSIPSLSSNPILDLHSDSLVPHQARCQVGIKGTNWLITGVYFGCTCQTDGLRFKAAGDFLKVNLINIEQWHMAVWGKQVAGGSDGRIRWSVGCPVGADWYNLFSYYSTATHGLNNVSWIEHNEHERKSMLQCISMVGRFIA